MSVLSAFRTMVTLAALAACAVARADFEVYFMRHGETQWNRAKILQGSISHPDITEVGVRMAEDTARGLVARGIFFDRVYSSPYRRARHTAEIVAARQGRSVQDEPRIRERCCGSCEGRAYANGEELAKLMAESKGVESVDAVGDRVMDFFTSELAPLDGKVKRVLCVGHTLLLNIIAARLSGSGTIEKTLLPNCCMHVFEYRDGRFSVKERAKVFYDPAAYASGTATNATGACRRQ